MLSQSNGQTVPQSVSPLFGISELSFDSALLSPLLFFCLLLLLFLCCLFSAYWPILLTYFQKFFQYFSLRDRLFGTALVQRLGDDTWLVACCRVVLVFAIMHLYNM